MQLKNRGALSAATAVLLGGLAPAAQSAEPKWTFDTAALAYSESGGRVQAFEPKLRGTRDLGNDRSFSIGMTLDSLTGASPNGAAPADTPQTFSRPSGAGSYTTAPGDLPLDDTFRDTRIALDGSYTRPLGESYKLTTSLGVSKEYDYLSIAAGSVLSRDFNLRNTTVSLGLNVSNDSIDPEGGIPLPLSVMPAPGAPTGRAEGSDSKQVVDILASVTQLLSRDSLVQFSYSLSQSSGYLSDPFKILSVVDANGDPLRYVYESRPDTRVKQAIFGQYKHFIADRDVLDLSLRLMTDDWGIASETLDASYRWNFSDTRYLEPHLRYYRQGEADFYRSALDDGEENQVTNASSDPRLGRFDALTLGVKYGQTLRSGNQWSLRLEGYTQQGQASGLPVSGSAALQRFDLEPSLDAVMITAGYRFRW